MKFVLNSEFRKLLTLRSTYILTVIVIGMVGLDAMLTARNAAVASEPIPATFLGNAALSSVIVAGILAAIYAAIFMAHEYRHNLIYHTLTLANTRLQSLAAKAATLLTYGFVLSVISVLVAVVCAKLGVSIGGGELPPSDIAWVDLLLRGYIYVAGYVLAGLLLAVLFRSVVVPIVLIILVPGTAEPLLSNVVFDNLEAYYLPFTALQMVVTPMAPIAPAAGTAIFMAYLIFGWLVGGYLFQRRDATSV